MVMWHAHNPYTNTQTPEELSAQSGPMRRAFVERNADVDGLVRQGMSIEYVPEDDHLYVTFGEPRPGMAIFFGEVVAIADFDTLECVAVEVLGFRQNVESGELAGWEPMLRLVEQHPVIDSKHDRDAREELAKDLQRVLVHA